MTKFTVKSDIIITSKETLSEEQQTLISLEIEQFLNSLPGMESAFLRFHFKEVIPQ